MLIFKKIPQSLVSPIYICEVNIPFRNFSASDHLGQSPDYIIHRMSLFAPMMHCCGKIRFFDSQLVGTNDQTYPVGKKKHSKIYDLNSGCASIKILKGKRGQEKHFFEGGKEQIRS